MNRKQNNESKESLPDDVVLSVRGVSKKFCRNLRRSMWYGVQDLCRNLVGLRATPVSDSSFPVPLSSSTDNHKRRTINQELPPLRPDEFWALQNISFDIKRGECLGLIGRNGSGKTTLLRLIAGIFPPDAGEIAIRGRVGALIALGAGFHPHMTGRENVFLNGAILGLHQKEIERQLDEIVDFAEIGEFIDAPVATYSSGMRVRLGFAVATAIHPDLLVLDEVLAVGDAAFRNKCYDKIGQLLKKCAVIFVTHHLPYVSRACNCALLLEKGSAKYHGSTSEAIGLYEQDAGSCEVETLETYTDPIVGCSCTIYPLEIQYGESIQLHFMLKASTPIEGAHVIVNFFDAGMQIVAQWFGKYCEHAFAIKEGNNQLDVELGPIHLQRGEYRVSIVIKDHSGLRQIYWKHKKDILSVLGRYKAEAGYLVPGRLLEQRSL